MDTHYAIKRQATCTHPLMLAISPPGSPGVLVCSLTVTFQPSQSACRQLLLPVMEWLDLVYGVFAAGSAATSPIVLDTCVDAPHLGA